LFKHIGQEGKPNEQEGSFDFAKRTTKKAAVIKQEVSVELKRSPYPKSPYFNLTKDKKYYFNLAILIGEEGKKK
jgi:hypothetical protein